MLMELKSWYQCIVQMHCLEYFTTQTVECREMLYLWPVFCNVMKASVFNSNWDNRIAVCVSYPSIGWHNVKDMEVYSLVAKCQIFWVPCNLSSVSQSDSIYTVVLRLVMLPRVVMCHVHIIICAILASFIKTMPTSFRIWPSKDVNCSLLGVSLTWTVEKTHSLSHPQVNSFVRCDKNWSDLLSKYSEMNIFA